MYVIPYLLDYVDSLLDGYSTNFTASEIVPPTEAHAWNDSDTWTDSLTWNDAE